MFVCLHFSPALSPDFLHEITPRLLKITPRVLLDRERLLWLDARGLNADTVVSDALELIHECGIGELKACTAMTPVAASVAALHGSSAINAIAPGTDREFLAPFPLSVLGPSTSLA